MSRPQLLPLKVLYHTSQSCLSHSRERGVCSMCMTLADTGAAAADDDEGSDGAQTIQQVYVERLKKLLVAPVTHLSSGKGAKKKYKHHYASTITSDQAAVSSAVCALVAVSRVCSLCQPIQRATRRQQMGSSTVKRCKAELRGQKQTLPLMYESSVFVRYSKGQPYIQQALITGPADTPYDSGCFLFDVYWYRNTNAPH